MQVPVTTKPGSVLTHLAGDETFSKQKLTGNRSCQKKLMTVGVLCIYIHYRTRIKFTQNYKKIYFTNKQFARTEELNRSLNFTARYAKLSLL